VAWNKSLYVCVCACVYVNMYVCVLHQLTSPPPLPSSPLLSPSLTLPSPLLLFAQSALGSEQMSALLCAIFNCRLPHPDMDWAVFRAEVAKQLSSCHKVFNPLSGMSMSMSMSIA